MQKNEINIDSLFSTFHLALPEKEKIESLERSFIELPDHKSIHDLVKARILICSFYSFANITKFEDSLVKLSELLSSQHEVEYQAWYDLYQARYFQIRDNTEEAIASYRKAISLAEQGFPRITAQALFRLATIYNNFGAIDEATQCYLKCVDICASTNGLRLQVLALSSLSEIYLANGQINQALELCTNAIQINSNNNDKNTTFRLHIRKCTILLEEGKPNEVLTILETVQEQALAHPDPLTQGLINTILGKAYRLKEDYEYSRSRFEAALSSYRASNDAKMITNVLQQLVELYVEIGKYDEAWKLLEEAKELALKTNYQYGITGSLELSVELYQKQGEFDKALAAFREFYDMKQKMLSQQAERRMELLRIEHQVKQKEQEAELYRLKSEQLEKQLMDKTSHLVSQAESMSRFRDDLKKILIEAKDPIAGLREVKDKLKDIPQIAVDWDEYDRNFSVVHPQFKQTILNRYPDLTPTEMKVCTLLRMELSSKEIAHLLTVDERSIENYRYKLRKKFKLEKESLSLFLSKV
jgi:tetratricopeptide (TPR) repeat protein